MVTLPKYSSSVNIYVLKLSYGREVKTLTLMMCTLWNLDLKEFTLPQQKRNIEVKSGIVASNNPINSPPLIKVSTLPLFCHSNGTFCQVSWKVSWVKEFIGKCKLWSSSQRQRHDLNLTNVYAVNNVIFWYLLKCWWIVYICHVYFTVLLYVMYCMLFGFVSAKCRPSVKSIVPCMFGQCSIRTSQTKLRCDQNIEIWGAKIPEKPNRTS